MKIDYLKDKFSFSKLQLFAKCPRRAFFRYVAKCKEPLSEALFIGRGTHAGQEHDNLERTKGRRPLRKQVLDAAVTAYEEDGGANADDFVEQHDIHLKKFWESGERDKINPVADTVEATFSIDAAVTHDPDEVPEKKPVLIEGFVDVVSEELSGALCVIDYKTVGRPVSQKDAESSNQMELYKLGAQAEYGKFVSFVKRGKQKPTCKVTERVMASRSRVQRLLTFLSDTINAFRRCIKTGDWPKCAPECHWCSKTACGFYDRCYPEKDKTLPKFISVGDIRPAGSLPPSEWRQRGKPGKQGK